MNRSTGSKSESKDYRKILSTEEKKEVVFFILSSLKYYSGHF